MRPADALHEELAQLAELAPLEVLDADDQRRVADHLAEGCETCRARHASGAAALETLALAGPLATHLEDGLKFLHASGPIRVLERAEWSEQGLREFGLDPPAYTVRLFHDGRAVLAVAFGAENPQKVLQYMRVAGRDPILVMSRSLGRQWEQVLSEAAR